MSTFYLNSGMERKQATTFQIPETMKTACLRCSCIVSIGVLKKMRQHSGGNEYTTFSRMIADISAFLKTGNCIDGDGIQLVFSAYEEFTNQLEMCVKSGKITEHAFNILHPFETASDSFNTYLFSTFCAEKHEIPYISSRVKIYNSESASVEMKMFSPYQLASRKLRKYVNSHVCPDVRRQKAVYLDGMTETEIDGITYTERLYYEIDIAENNAPTEKTLETCKTISDYIAEMQLTDSQKEVLKLRLQGYGYRAIATYRGTSPQAVLNMLNKIAQKARKIAELQITDFDILEQACNAIGIEPDAENHENTRKTVKIDTSKMQTAKQIYTKNAKTRAKRAKMIARYLKNKNKIAEKRYAQNARICAENERICFNFHEFYQIEQDAKILAMYYSE